MLKDLHVKVGPQFYSYYEGALYNVPKLLNEFHAKNILIVHGGVSWEKAKPWLTFIDEKKDDQTFYYHKYTGECSYYGADLINDIVKTEEIDFIIGVGGGKLTDLVGYSAHIGNVNFGVIPTMASNCAPWTPLSVMYKETGEAEGKTEHFLRQSSFLITDPNLVIDSPISYFIAGLADTLAKWYESDAILSQNELKDEPFLNMARSAALLCKDAILADSEKAITDMKNKNTTDEFVKLSEIIFGIAGLVGGLGDKYARNTAAHAMHDALSKYIPESHNYLHGEKVAYGIFYQLSLENKWEIIDELLPFYNNLGLPTSLKSMTISLADPLVMDQVVEFIYSKDKVHLVPIVITKEVLKNGIIDLENYMDKN